MSLNIHNRHAVSTSLFSSPLTILSPQTSVTLRRQPEHTLIRRGYEGGSIDRLAKRRSRRRIVCGANECSAELHHVEIQRSMTNEDQNAYDWGELSRLNRQPVAPQHNGTVHFPLQASVVYHMASTQFVACTTINIQTGEKLCTRKPAEPE